MFHLNEHVNMWRNREAFLKWYSVVLLLAREDFLRVSMFHEQCMANIAWRRLVPISKACPPFHPQRVQNLHPGDSAIRLEFCRRLYSNRQLLSLVPFTD